MRALRSGSLSLGVLMLFCSAAYKSEPAADAKKQSSAEFMKSNAKAKGIVVLPGLQYHILQSGERNGLSPKSSDIVTVHYEGKLPTGLKFDSSFDRGEPASIPLRQVIPGWQAILKMMRPGDEWEVVIPAELGYGARGSGPIPPDSALIFKIQLISFKAPEKTSAQ